MKGLAIVVKKFFSYINTASTSIFVFPAIISILAAFEILRAVVITHPRYGIRISMFAILIATLWVVVFAINQRKIRYQEHAMKLTISLLPTIIIAFFVGTFMLYAVWGSGFLTLAPYEQIDNGTQHLDSLFHSSIAESIKRSIVSKVLLNDEEILVYHTFSHLLLGMISWLIRIPAFIAYNFLFPVIFYPIYLLAQFAAVSEAKNFFESKRTITFLNVVIIVFFNVGIFYKELLSSYGIWQTTFILSESFLISNTLALLSYASIFYFFGKYSKETKKANFFSIIFIPIEIFLISWAKISVGFIFTVTIMYYVFRRHIKDIRFWGLNVLYFMDFVLCLRLFNSSGSDIGGKISSSFKWLAFGGFCDGELGIWGHFLILLIMPAMFIVLDIYRNRYTWNDFKYGKTVFVEIIIIGSIMAFLPALVMVIQGGSAAYFSYAIEIPALVLLCGSDYFDIEKNATGNVKMAIYVSLFLLCIWNSYTNRTMNPVDLITQEHSSNLSSVLLEIRNTVADSPEEYTIYLENDSVPAQVFGDKRACYVCPAMTGVAVINATYIEGNTCYSLLGDEVVGYGFFHTDSDHVISFDEALRKAKRNGKNYLIHMTKSGYEILDLRE